MPTTRAVKRNLSDVAAATSVEAEGTSTNAIKKEDAANNISNKRVKTECHVVTLNTAAMTIDKITSDAVAITTTTTTTTASVATTAITVDEATTDRGAAMVTTEEAATTEKATTTEEAATTEKATTEEATPTEEANIATEAGAVEVGAVDAGAVEAGAVVEADDVVEVGATAEAGATVEANAKGVVTVPEAAAAATYPKPFKPVRSLLNTKFPSHLNPNNPLHFDHFIFQLLALRAETKNNNAVVNKEEYPAMYCWLKFIKKEYKNYSTAGADPSLLTPPCVLTAQQFLVLESLHVPLTSRGDDHWNRYYDQLVAYKARHGHVLVPRLCEVPGLGDWVTDQRRQYKAKQQGQPSQLSDSRQEKLEALDFVWLVRNRPEWEVRYAELLEYKAEKGNCKVPQHYKPNKALGKWVAKQREQYKRLHKGQHSFLTPYRVEKLTAVGFVWQIRTSLEGELNAVTAETAAAAPPPVVKSPLANKSEPETPPVDADIPKAVIEEGVENEETTKGKETIRSEEVTTSDEMIKDEEMVKVEEMINDEDEGITKDKKIGVEV